MELINVHARAMRKNPTEAERLLWYALRGKKMGVKFRRQHPIDDTYIVDFICTAKRLIIELDGGQHAQSNEDVARALYLQHRGYKILRFWDSDIICSLDSCLEIVTAVIQGMPSFPPGESE
jgi:very-short-patch-repair endonuclease